MQNEESQPPTPPAYLRELTIKYRKKRVKNGAPVDEPLIDPEQVAALFRDMEDEAKEKMVAICLDAKLKVICFEVVAIGTVNGIYGRPAEVLRAPIALNAYNVILVHNHPSGDPTPSPEDETFTRELRRYMQGLGIRFCDHIIIGQGDYYSFSDAGVL
ncbi:MAG: JAB domain-containing protein [Verrucomicrobiota bacterium]